MRAWLLVLALALVPQLGAAQPGRLGGDGGRCGWCGPGWHAPAAVDIPSSLPAPPSDAWLATLRLALSLERHSREQYEQDAQRFAAAMPYQRILPQELEHIRTLERLFAAYGTAVGPERRRPEDTTSLEDALATGRDLEEELLGLYERLEREANYDAVAAALGALLLDTRMHRTMFEHALSRGGAHMGRGHGPMRWGR